MLYFLKVFNSYFLDQELTSLSSCSTSFSRCGDLFRKSLRLHHFKSDRDEIWQEFFSTKYASTDGTGFP